MTSVIPKIMSKNLQKFSAIIDLHFYCLRYYSSSLLFLWRVQPLTQPSQFSVYILYRIYCPKISFYVLLHLSNMFLWCLFKASSLVAFMLNFWGLNFPKLLFLNFSIVILHSLDCCPCLFCYIHNIWPSYAQTFFKWFDSSIWICKAKTNKKSLVVKDLSITQSTFMSKFFIFIA